MLFTEFEAAPLLTPGRVFRKCRGLSEPLTRPGKSSTHWFIRT